MDTFLTYVGVFLVNMVALLRPFCLPQIHLRIIECTHYFSNMIKTGYSGVGTFSWQHYLTTVYGTTLIKIDNLV